MVGRVQHSHGRRQVLGSTRQVPGLGLPGSKLSSAARRRVSRVAVRACRRQCPSEAQSCPGVGSCVSHSSRQHSPSEGQGRHLSHRLQRVQDLQRVVVFAAATRARVGCRHVCIRCLQPRKLASCHVQQKRKADRAKKDKSSWT